MTCPTQKFENLVSPDVFVCDQIMNGKDIGRINVNVLPSGAVYAAAMPRVIEFKAVLKTWQFLIAGSAAIHTNGHLAIVRVQGYIHNYPLPCSATLELY